MKRYLLAVLLIPVLFIVMGLTIEARGSNAQPTKKSGKKTAKKKKAGDGKSAITCPAAVMAENGTIKDCPTQGAAEVSILI